MDGENTARRNRIAFKEKEDENKKDEEKKLKQKDRTRNRLGKTTYLRATSSSPLSSAKHAILYSYLTVHPSGLSGRAPVPSTGAG
jgi:hypothetical protein